jgi:glycosyltransferase involved in cell wall biosynthesis
MSNLRVAMIAPPWLTIPPNGYGGIEEVVFSLIRELKKQNVDIELFSVGKTKIRGVKNHYLYDEGQYQHIHKPVYESLPIAIAHMQFALNYIEQDGTFDIIHDHNVNTYIGPFILQYAAKNKHIPPAIQTLHGPPFSTKQTIEQDLPDNRPYWRQIGLSAEGSYFVSISKAQEKSAPKELRSKLLPYIYNAVNPSDFIYRDKKKPYFLTLARFSRDKGQHIAAQLCSELGYSLRMAGQVAGLTSPRQLFLELSNPLSSYRNAGDFRYYSDKVLPYTANFKNINYIGNIAGQKKLLTIANARALLFPINWEEPFGMAVIESLASGTPVIAMRRGAMPEIIEHGVNGFLANTASEFRSYMQRIDEIDPAACRDSIKSKFSSEIMAEHYLRHYRKIVHGEIAIK